MPKKTSRYAFRTVDGGYEAAKMDDEGNGLEVYKLNKTGSECNCPAHVPFCRHKQMLQIFIREGKINTGWMYDHDKKQWFEPQKLGGTLADLFDDDGTSDRGSSGEQTGRITF